MNDLCRIVFNAYTYSYNSINNLGGTLANGGGIKSSSLLLKRCYNIKRPKVINIKLNNYKMG